jgi:hypothetical protein
MLVGHWPLIGNTNDYSGFNNNGTPTSITYTAGKIGQAGNFNGSTSSILTPLTTQNLTRMSLSFWIYNTASGAAGLIGTISGGRSLSVFRYPNRDDFHWSTVGSSGVDSDVLPFNTWTHVCLTYNGSLIKRYYNGVFFGQTSGTIAQNTAPIYIGRNDSGYSNILLNDVRIYDHALSDYEVKELAKAKILHYTFDDQNEEPTVNILSGKLTATTHTRNFEGKTISGWQLTGIANDNPRLFIHSSSIAVSASTNYAFSALYYSSTGVIDDVYFQFNDSGWPEGNIFFQPFVSGQSTAKGGTSTITNLGGGWFYCVGTFLTNAATTTISSVFLDSDVAGTTVFIGELQLEQKNYATPFTNGTRNIGVADS